MFLNYLKDFFVKKRLKKSLPNLNYTTLYSSVRTIGLIIDGTYCLEKEALLNEIIANGISRDNIKLIVYKDKLSPKEVSQDLTFSGKQLNWKSENTDVAIIEFVNEKFDLLISYYDIEKVALLAVTNQSRAKFKVGFSTIDKRLNHLMINTTAENYTIFMHEVFRYLKILNKI